MKRFLLLLLALCGMLTTHAQDRTVRLSVIGTTDVHGNYFPTDFVSEKLGKGSLARVHSYVEYCRNRMGKDKVILLDNGDLLQGQPVCYYYNRVSPQPSHIGAEVLNFMRYDAATIGNHDIETGPRVYDKWQQQCHFNVLGANVLLARTGRPYFRPYTILNRGGVKVAVLGLVTPQVPAWLPEKLWQGMQFADMVETAKQYMPILQREADVIVGLFHSGIGTGDEKAGELAENATMTVAREVPGFDFIICGHDHREYLRKVENTEGDSVFVINPAAGAEKVAQANLTLQLNGNKVVKKAVDGRIISINAFRPDPLYMGRFKARMDSVRAYASKVIARNQTPLDAASAYFGPSPLIDFIHQVQLTASGADISFAAPLSADAALGAGEVRMRDMFTLYPYENELYTLELTGREVKDYLEYSYAQWTAQMTGPDSHILLFKPAPEKIRTLWGRFVNPTYNFDSGAGIRYTVDVTQPAGRKVNIQSMADGRPFSAGATYRVAVNSYRGNGGGGHLTQGAGIPKDSLAKRVVWTSGKDIRQYLAEAVESLGTLNLTPLDHWKFIPEDKARKGLEKDLPLVRQRAVKPRTEE